jgi:hypothetical protein
MNAATVNGFVLCNHANKPVQNHTRPGIKTFYAVQPHKQTQTKKNVQTIWDTQNTDVNTAIFCHSM